jgi:hypothetical protein
MVLKGSRKHCPRYVMYVIRSLSRAAMMEGEYTPQSLCVFSPERPRKSPVVRATGERVDAQAQ